MTTTQPDFVAALLDPQSAVPEGLTDPEGRPAGRRFSVYRNNVAVSLTDALQTAFPVIAKLIGEENFKGLAGLFLRKHPPRSPLLMFYGEAMPGFLEGFQPLAHIGYLPDIARLELALRQAYHAADAAPADPARLQEIAPDRLMDARLTLAPAVRLIRSRWPIHAVWRFNMEPGAPKPAMAAEDVLVSRPDMDPVQTVLPQGGGAFVAALAEGATFGKAVDRATAETAGFDLSVTLATLLAAGALSKIEG